LLCCLSLLLALIWTRRLVVRVLSVDGDRNRNQES
jgi:hypothetical protein